jgi:hypothetical protein
VSSTRPAVAGILRGRCGGRTYRHCGRYCCWKMTTAQWSLNSSSFGVAFSTGMSPYESDGHVPVTLNDKHTNLELKNARLLFLGAAIPS